MNAVDRVNHEEGYIGITEAARMAGLDPKVMRRRLRVLNAKFGMVLFRFSDAVNGKLWTTPQALRRVMPERFDEVSHLDLIELRGLITELQQRAHRTERRLGRLEHERRKVG